MQNNKASLELVEYRAN